MSDIGAYALRFALMLAVLGIAIAVNFGFTVAALSALACYAFALVHALRGEWAGPAD